MLNQQQEVTMEDRVIRTLRAQAWQRAKGELQAVLHTYFGERDRFEAMDSAVQELIKTVEDDGLAE